MRTVTENAWAIFRSAFKDGDEVVIETSSGDFFWGRLTVMEEQLLLTRPDGRSRQWDWDLVELICHDGFPVRKLFRMTPEEAAKRANATSNELIHAAFDGEFDPPRAYYGGGCPWVAGPMRLVNIHNRGSRRQDDGAEVMVFQADDGAVMHSYDTDHLFLDF